MEGTDNKKTLMVNHQGTSYNVCIEAISCCRRRRFHHDRRHRRVEDG